MWQSHTHIPYPICHLCAPVVLPLDVAEFLPLIPRALWLFHYLNLSDLPLTATLVHSSKCDTFLFHFLSVHTHSYSVHMPSQFLQSTFPKKTLNSFLLQESGTSDLGNPFLIESIYHCGFGSRWMLRARPQSNHQPQAKTVTPCQSTPNKTRLTT